MDLLVKLTCLFALVFSIYAYSAEDEHKLGSDLILSYPAKHIRPLKSEGKPIKVSLGLSLIRLEGLDESSGTLHLNLWIRYLWKDEYLTWDPSKYGNISHMRMPMENIWSPDITLYNRVGRMDVESVLAVVSSDGNVLYIPPGRTQSHCNIDLTYFPFDTQECVLKFGSWVYSDSELDLEFYDGLEKMDVNDYIHNQEWDLISTRAKKNIKFYPCCEEGYPDLTFSLTMRRITDYYTYVTLGPAILLSLLAPFIFLLPPGNPQKMTLGIGVLICFTLFFMEMSTMMPTVHSGTPLVDKYYMTLYVLLCVAMALSTLICNLAKRTITMKHPPEFIKKVLLSCLGRCLCISYNMYGDLPPSDTDHPESKIVGNMQRQESSGAEIREWLLIATVVDRLCFLVYLVLSVLLTIIILSCRG